MATSNEGMIKNNINRYYDPIQNYRVYKIVLNLNLRWSNDCLLLCVAVRVGVCMYRFIQFTLASCQLRCAYYALVA